MGKINLEDIQSIKYLLYVAQQDLQGKRLIEIDEAIGESNLVERRKSKGYVGYLIENGYFGIKKNSDAKPDIKHLGVEVKTWPLIKGKDGKLRTKEPLSLNIINYTKEVTHSTFIESSVYKKNRYILFVCYIHDPEIPRSEYLVKYVFIWEMNEQVINDLEADYQKILDKIRKGQAHEIHQTEHTRLTLCPKHNGKFKDPLCQKSKTKQPYSSAPAEIRAFRIKNSYMNEIMRRYLTKNHPEDLPFFVK